MRKVCLALLIIFCCVSSRVSGQETVQMLRFYSEKDGLSHKHVTQMLQDEDGFLWFSTWNGLNRFDGYNFECFKTKAGDGCDMPTDRLRNIMLGKDGNIWCKTDNDVFLFVRDSAYFRSVSSECSDSITQLLNRKSTTRSVRTAIKVNGVELTDAKRMFNDRQGNIWIIGEEGIYEITESVKPGIVVETGKMVRSLCHGFVALSDNVLYKYDSENKLLPVWLGATGYCMTFLKEDSSLLYGTKPDGLYRIKNGKTIQHLTSETSTLTNDNVYGVAEDRHGRVWVATMGGGISCLGYDVKPSDDKVRHLFLYGDTLVACSTDGIIVADVSEADVASVVFKRHKREANRRTSLSSNSTMMSLVDDKGRLIVCTESGGLSITCGNLLADTLSFAHVNRDVGLMTDITYSAFVHNGDLWVVSSDKLIKVDVDNNNCSTFGPAYWHRDLRFSEAIPSQLDDGRWMLGLVDGALVVDVDSIRHDDYVPELVLTSMTIIGEKSSYVVNYSDEIHLKPDERDFNISFAAIDFRDVNNVCYAYRLSDEDEWNYTRHPSASFLNVLPGEYELTVRSTNADGQWVDNSRKLRIIVEPAFAETIWAEILVIFLICMAVASVTYTIVYIRRLSHERRQTLEAYLALLDDKNKRKQAVANDRQKTLKANIQANDDVMMRRLMTYINENIGNSDIKVEDLASAAAISKSALVRKVKEMVGLTPSDLLKEARIQKACDMLKDTTLTINDVAIACGFSDSKYFARCFKSTEGQTPTQYRESVKVVD